MKTLTHTPGPWHVGFKPGPIVYSAQGKQVANLFEPLIDAKENKANARLIAAAPELFKALKVTRSNLYAALVAMKENEASAPKAYLALDLAYSALAKAQGNA